MHLFENKVGRLLLHFEPKTAHELRVYVVFTPIGPHAFTRSHHDSWIKDHTKCYASIKGHNYLSLLHNDGGLY